MIKNLFKLSFLAVLGITLLASCAKKTTAPPSNNPAMSATVNGTSWTAANVAASLNSGSVLVSGASAGSYPNLGLIISSTAPGTYQLSSTGNNGILYSKDANNSYASTSGSIVVTSYSNNIISGTFSGSCTNMSGGSDVLTITNGSFTAKVQ
jgi:hypothetical protein